MISPRDEHRHHLAPSRSTVPAYRRPSHAWAGLGATLILLALTTVSLAASEPPRVLYLYGDVAADGTIPSGSQDPFHQMRLNDTGILGMSQFRDAIVEVGYAIEERYDAATSLTSDLLANYRVLILGSNQKRFSTAERNAVGSWVNAGGGLIAWSDSAFGGDYQLVGVGNPTGRDSNNDLTVQFGMYFMRDNGAGNYLIGQYEFDHFLNADNRNGGVEYRGEGVSCVRVSAPAVMLATLQAGGLGGALRLHSDDPAFDPARDAALAIATIGSGRVIGTFDRNTFWNAGAGTRLSHVDNRAFAQRLVQWAAGSGSAPVNQPPVANASATPTSGTAPLVVNFSSAASSDSDGSIVSYHWSFGDGGSSTAANPSRSYNSAGTYTATLTVTDDDGATGSDSVAITVSAAPVGQGPYGGSPITVPASATARIQADNYDLGGEGVAYHDADASNQGGAYRSDGVDIQATSDVGGGYNVGWITAGEWLEYSIDVAAAGTYDVALRVARQPTGNAALHLEVDGQNLSGSVSVPSTGGWQNWTTVSTQVELAAGPQILRLALDASDFNVNWFELTRSDSGQSAYGGSPLTIAASGTTIIQAEDYDHGGQGVAYHDTDSSNQGGAYRSDGVDIQATSDQGGGFNVGWIAAGEWLEYSIDVTAAGTYDVDIRVARQPTGNAALHLEVDNQNLSGSVSVPSTGGWQTWTTVSTQVELEAGVQILRLALNGSSFNVNWFALTRQDDAPAQVVVAINAAGPAYTAVDGTLYSADQSVSGGSTYSTSASIAGSEDDLLYQSERWGAFSYAIPVSNGDYLLTLQFAEIYFTASGQRIFNVSVEGSEVVSDLDLFAQTGGRYIAYDVVIPVSVADGVLDLVFTATVNNPKLSALRLESVGTTSN